MTQIMRQKLKRVPPAIAVGTDEESRSWSRCLDRSSSTGISTNFAVRLEAVKAEWALICTAHNITKLAKAI